MKRYDKHIFVCENIRPEDNPRGSCGRKDSLDIKHHFKKRIKELGLNATIRANSAGCLDACELGPVIVIYPEQIWYGKVKLDDVEEIIQSHIINNKPVERLMITENKFNRDRFE